MIHLLIPTCRTWNEILPMVNQIVEATPVPLSITASCREGSASENRNWCLDECPDSEYLIMIDDDISGFKMGWWEGLMNPMIEDPHVMGVSARLMTKDGRVGSTCSRIYELEPKRIPITPAKNCVMPTAAIGFRNIGIRFDERFLGSGFEDGDWFFQYLRERPDSIFIQSNETRLIHWNEMKNQRKYWNHNQSYFMSKWYPERT